jgi:prefoldin subunit 5
VENNVDAFRKYQEQVNQTIQQISNNAIELQKNFFNTYQSSYSQFFDNINNNNNSYWTNFNVPERYSEIYNTVNKNIQDYTVNATNLMNEITALVVLRILIKQ